MMNELNKLKAEFETLKAELETQIESRLGGVSAARQRVDAILTVKIGELEQLIEGRFDQTTARVTELRETVHNKFAAANVNAANGDATLHNLISVLGASIDEAKAGAEQASP